MYLFLFAPGTKFLPTMLAARGFSVWPAVTTTLTRGLILTTYQKRWLVDVFHKSLKQNAALGKASVRRRVTQNNHVFAVLYAMFKLECLKTKQHLSHFALRAHLFLKATRIAVDELQASRPGNIS